MKIPNLNLLYIYLASERLMHNLKKSRPRGIFREKEDFNVIIKIKDILLSFLKEYSQKIVQDINYTL